MRATATAFRLKAEATPKNLDCVVSGFSRKDASDSHSLPPKGGSHAQNLDCVASGFSRKDAAVANLGVIHAAFRLTASAKATASLAEALRAKAEAGSHAAAGAH